jgi:hypothetical protein
MLLCDFSYFYHVVSSLMCLPLWSIFILYRILDMIYVVGGSNPFYSLSIFVAYVLVVAYFFILR